MIPTASLRLAEAARLSSLSVDTLRRNHRDKFIRLSERRYGMSQVLRQASAEELTAFAREVGPEALWDVLITAL